MKNIIIALMFFSIALYPSIGNNGLKNNKLEDITFENMKPYDLYGGIGITSKYLIFEGISVFLTGKYLKASASINGFGLDDDDNDFGFFADVSGSFFPIINKDFRLGVYGSTGYYIGNLFSEGLFHFYEFGVTSETISKNSSFFFKIGVMRFKSGSMIPSLTLGTNMLY